MNFDLEYARIGKWVLPSGCKVKKWHLNSRQIGGQRAFFVAVPVLRFVSFLLLSLLLLLLVFKGSSAARPAKERWDWDTAAD